MATGMSDIDDVPADTSSDHEQANGPGPDTEVIDLTGDTDISESEEEDEEDSGSERSDDSDDSGIEIALNEHTRAKLQEAIFGVSEIRLRHIVQALAEEVPQAEEALIRELITLKRETLDVIPRWESCGRCNEEFDMAAAREEGECAFHPGTLRSSREDLNGVTDLTSQTEPQLESFSWSCCNTDSTSGGCTRGQHQPAIAKKRRRVEEVEDA